MRNTFIYVMVDKITNRVKIGRSKSPFSRLSALQTSCPSSLALAASFEVGSGKAETAAHFALKDYRLHGEWFNVHVDKAISVVEKVADEFPPSDANDDLADNRNLEQIKDMWCAFQCEAAYNQLLSFVSKAYPDDIFSDGLRKVADEVSNESALGIAVMSFFGMEKLVFVNQYLAECIKQRQCELESIRSTE